MKAGVGQRLGLEVGDAFSAEQIHWGDIGSF
jgi:hypothetical protein